MSLLRFFANEYREFAYCPTGKGGGIDNSCSPTGEAGTKAPWQMNQAEFDAATAAGRIVPATGKTTEAERAYAKTHKKGTETALGLGEAQDAIKEGKIKSHPDFPMFDSRGKVKK